jgi:hypothetical protein
LGIVRTPAFRRARLDFFRNGRCLPALVLRGLFNGEL